MNERHGPSSTVNDKASKLNIDGSSLTVQELKEVEQSIIRFTQSRSFDKELEILD